MTILDDDRSASIVEELCIQSHVLLGSARVNLDPIETHVVCQVDVAFIIDPMLTALTTRATYIHALLELQKRFCSGRC